MVYNNHKEKRVKKMEHKVNLIELRDVDTKLISFELLNLVRGKASFNDLDLNAKALAFIIYLFKKYNSEGKSSIFEKYKLRNETTREYLLQLLKEIDHAVISEYSEKFKENELLSFIFFSENDSFSESQTPFGIIQLATKLFNLKGQESVIDLCSGTGSFLSYVSYIHPNTELKGIEIKTSNIIISNIRSEILGKDINYIQGDALKVNSSEDKADSVFVNAPFGFRISQYFDKLSKSSDVSKYFINAKRTISSDWIFALKAIKMQNENGKTIALMTNAGTWNKADEFMRKQIIEDGLVEAVIALPANLFSNTSINTVMVIFSNNNKCVKFLDATHCFTKGRRINSLENKDVEKILNLYFSENENISTVSIENLRKHEYILNPNRHIQNNDLVEGFALGEICIEIRRGALISSADLDSLVSDKNTSYKYLMLKNIQNGIVDDQLPSLNEINQSNIKYCLKDGDLVISKNSPFKIARISIEEGTHILANGNLYIIELDSTKINPTYVEFYLQSDMGIAQLERLAKGTAIKNISIQDLKNVKIPHISVAKQNEISDRYIQLKNELRTIERQAEIVRKKQSELVEEISNEY